MLKKYNKLILSSFLSVLINTLSGELFAATPSFGTKPLQLADITPAQITPPQINPTQINPTQVNPTQINPTVINPTVINPTTINPTVINPTIINPTQINPTIINPTQINPTTINPSVITPSVIRPQIVNPAIVNPSITTPAITTPSIITPTTTTPTTTTPVTITPATVTPGGSSAAESTSMTIPNSTATDVNSIQQKTEFPSGMIVKINGEVEALVDNKKIHPLKAKSLFYTHQTIITKKNSNVGLRFNDGTFLVLGPESALEIKKFHFTIPAKGQTYTGSPKDRAVVKLLRGNLKAQLGTLALFNKASAFAILTPRGRLELTDAKTNSTVELIYNNKVGLTVKAVGVLSNSKGQVTLNDKSFGLASAVIGSSPTTTSTVPMVFSEGVMTSTAAFFLSQLSLVNTAYSERIIADEERAMATDAADTAGDRDASSDSDVASLSADEDGDDDGGDEDIDDDDDDINNEEDDSNDDSGDD